MQLQLKQSEIETAIKQYLNSTGISTGDKDVTINFRVLRKGKGAVADVSIEAASGGYGGDTAVQTCVQPDVPGVSAESPAEASTGTEEPEAPATLNDYSGEQKSPEPKEVAPDAQDILSTAKSSEGSEEVRLSEANQPDDPVEKAASASLFA